ncbi:MAG: dephospho-CoA kinase [Bacilli bacterium]
MKVIGITGGIASGKSTVSNKLIEYGYKVLDCDIIAREVSSSKSVIDQIKEVFGEEYFEDGVLIRKKLGETIFTNSDLKKELEDIIHPLVIDRIKEEIRVFTEDILFVDCPLLYEANLEYLFDKVIVVYISKDIQEFRLIQRDEISVEYAKAKIDSQLPILMKKNRADYIIDNSHSLEKTYEQIEKIVRRIKNEI